MKRRKLLKAAGIALASLVGINRSAFAANPDCEESAEQPPEVAEVVKLTLRPGVDIAHAEIVETDDFRPDLFRVLVNPGHEQANYIYIKLPLDFKGSADDLGYITQGLFDCFRQLPESAKAAPFYPTKTAIEFSKAS